MAQPSLSRLLTSASVPRDATLVRLAAALEVPVETLRPDVPRVEVPGRLLACVVDAWDPLEIWLFGSRARGDAREHSDWDLLVIVPDDAPEQLLDPVLGMLALEVAGLHPVPYQRLGLGPGELGEGQPRLHVPAERIAVRHGGESRGVGGGRAES